MAAAAHYTIMDYSPQQASLSYPGQQMSLPQARTGSGSQFGPSSTSPPALDDDSMSTCSDRCSQETCSGCCEGDECNGACIEACHGFIDCDDSEACTRSDCAELDCRDIAPPCFDRNCLQRLTGKGMAEDNRPVYRDFLGNNGLDNEGDGNDSLQKHDLEYPSATTVNRVEAPSMIPSMSPSKDGTPMDVDSTGVQCLWGTGCDEEFCDWSALDEHIYRTHIKPQNEVRCQWDNCDQATDPNKIIDHVRTDHSSSSSDGEGNEQTCHWSECSLTLPPGPSGLANHVLSTHVPTERKPLECQWGSCGFTTDDPANLSAHLQIDHFPDLVIQNYSSTDSLESVAEASAMQIDQSPDPLAQSKWSADSPESSPRIAPEASSSMQDAGAALHICYWMKAAGDEGNSEDRIMCGSQFPDAASIQQHIKEEHIKPLSKKTGFACQWEGCPRGVQQPFGQKQKLERHVQVHTKLKKSRCDICGKSFSGPVALMLHTRTHTGEKPFECEICSRTFAYSTALIMHMRTHTKERPLKCDYPRCGKTFSESSTLSKHKKIHAEQEPYRCTFPDCISAFRRADQLKRHYYLVHNGLPEDVSGGNSSLSTVASGS